MAKKTADQDNILFLMNIAAIGRVWEIILLASVLGFAGTWWYLGVSHWFSPESVILLNIRNDEISSLSGHRHGTDITK